MLTESKSVFISFSGKRSYSFADALRGEILKLFPGLRVFMSDQIEGGRQWFPRISHELETCHFGIICITRENRLNPWIQFEAGYLAGSSKDGGKGMPLLLDKELKLAHPLAAYQYQMACLEEYVPLIDRIASAVGAKVPKESAIADSWKPLAAALKNSLDVSSDDLALIPMIHEQSWEIERRTPFRQWLRGRVLTSVFKSLSETSSPMLFNGFHNFRWEVGQLLQSAPVGTSVFALCGRKPFGIDDIIESYYKEFFNFGMHQASEENQKGEVCSRVRVCRLFVEGGTGLEEKQKVALDAHDTPENRKNGVLGVTIGKGAADVIPGFSARLKQGFGFVLFCRPGPKGNLLTVYTHAEDRDGRFIFSEFVEYQNVGEIWRLANQLLSNSNLDRTVESDIPWEEFFVTSAPYFGSEVDS